MNILSALLLITGVLAITIGLGLVFILILLKYKIDTVAAFINIAFLEYKKYLIAAAIGIGLLVLGGLTSGIRFEAQKKEVKTDIVNELDKGLEKLFK